MREAERTWSGRPPRKARCGSLARAARPSSSAIVADAMRAYERQQKEMKELRAEINSLRKIESAAASVRCQMARVEPHSRRSVAQRGVAG